MSEQLTPDAHEQSLVSQAETDESLAVSQEAISDNKPSFLRRHRTAATIGAVATAAVVAAPHAYESAHTLAENAHWAVPSLVATEAAWNVGAATMLVSAGRKMGNPLTLHRRFRDVLSGVRRNGMFRAGLATNVAGELGTASVIVGGSVAYLPPATWPLTMGASALLAAPGVMVWSALRREGLKDKTPEQQVPELEEPGYETDKYCNIVKMSPADESLWAQMGVLRAESYVHAHQYLSEEVLDEHGREYDEYDYSDGTLHLGAVNPDGDLVGVVRLIGRNKDVNDGLLPYETVYDSHNGVSSMEISRFIVDKERGGSAADAATISLALLRSLMHHARDGEYDRRVFAMMDRPLIRYFNGVIGIGIKEVEGAKQLSEIDTVDALVEFSPRLATSQIARHEQENPRKIGNYEHLAPFFEDNKVQKGLGRVSLSSGEVSIERFDRNFGWINEAEQRVLSDKKVLIAGVGGDGGALAVNLARAGVMHFRLADPEIFEVENINRQEGADFTTIGRYKAEVIAEKIKAINPTATVEVHENGITPENMKDLVDNVDLIIDETEYTKQELPVMLAREARQHGISVLTALNVGFGAYVTSYDPNGKTFESQIGINETTPLEEVATTKASIASWVPHIPSYSDMKLFSKVAAGERSTPTVSAGVQLAAGTATTQALAHLLHEVSPQRKKWITYYPRGISIDAVDGTKTIKHPKLHFYLSAGRAALRTALGRNPKMQ
jgi:molybdopterin/thiamine biosynthesis adenylyltransferase/N-acyl-L-homoserine lactone synthetase